MYIAPNSTIRLLHNVPIDPNQTDTLWFSDSDEQANYFLGKTVTDGTFENNTYQRVNRGTCRLNVLADKIYDVNYMMFRNTNYSRKWFYAFVDKVEYINDNTSEISFTIDSVQTWFFNYDVEQCFVERETTATDAIGEHIEPENVNVGEYVINGNYESVGSSFTDMSIIVVYDDPSDTLTNLYDGVMSATRLKVYDATSQGIQQIQSFLSTLTTEDAVKNIYMCPKALAHYVSGGSVLSFGTSGEEFDVQKTPLTAGYLLDGYLPRNNKMYTYPYNYAHVDNSSGQSLTLRYEFFKDLTPRFHITGNVTTPVEIVCIPLQYKNSDPGSSGGLGVPADEYRPERLSIKGFPLCNWSQDYYSLWVAQTSVPRLITTAGSVLSAVASGNTSQGTNAIISGAASTLAGMYTASIHADVSRGSFETGSNDFSNKRMHFKFCRMSLTHQYAKRIDDFFTCFGYSVGVIKAPQRHLRSRFTYVKTIGCNVSGSLPSSDAKYIADCYDRGIRFWADVDNVCNYNARNNPLG